MTDTMNTRLAREALPLVYQAGFRRARNAKEHGHDRCSKDREHTAGKGEADEIAVQRHVARSLRCSGER